MSTVTIIFPCARLLLIKLGVNVEFVDNPTDEQLSAADVVIATVGTIDLECVERPFSLSEADEALVVRTAANNSNTVVLVITGSGVRMTDWNDRVAAILYCWYPGQNGMRAVADIRRRRQPFGQASHDHRP